MDLIPIPRAPVRDFHPLQTTGSEAVFLYIGRDRFSAKKEAKRLEALAKKATKLPKQAAEGLTSGEKKKSEKTAEKTLRKEEDEPFVNTTPKGEKKGSQCSLCI